MSPRRGLKSANGSRIAGVRSDEGARWPRVILCIENSAKRVRDFTRWLPDGVNRLHAVEVGSTALGVVNRMQPDDYIGVMLDFNLDEAPLGIEGRLLSLEGNAAAEALARRRLRHLPVLVHSHHPPGAAYMANLLEDAGFDVTTCRYDRMTKEFFREWVEECLEQLKERQE